jgi:hypothetical protein
MKTNKKIKISSILEMQIDSMVWIAMAKGCMTYPMKRNDDLSLKEVIDFKDKWKTYCVKKIIKAVKEEIQMNELTKK